MSIALLRERAAAQGLPLGIVAAESLHVILLVVRDRAREVLEGAARAMELA